jgi:hypothetical protein
VSDDHFANYVGHNTRTHLKNRILVQDRGGAAFKTAGNLLAVEDWKRGPNKDMGPKDIFEVAYRCSGTKHGDQNVRCH